MLQCEEIKITDCIFCVTWSKAYWGKVKIATANGPDSSIYQFEGDLGIITCNELTA